MRIDMALVSAPIGKISVISCSAAGSYSIQDEISTDVRLLLGPNSASQANGK